MDLVVEEGECFGLLGPNGAGKTTTMEILEGLLDATSGEVEVLGLPLGSRRRRDPRADRHLAAGNAAGRQAHRPRNAHALSQLLPRRASTPTKRSRRVSLEEKANAWFVKLSGGQKQRLAVACALVGDPQLLFLDEPTTGLDPQSRRQLWDVIRTFRATGRTVMLTTHYMDEAERLCDRVAVVDHGKVIALGSPAKLIAQLGGENIVVVLARRRARTPFDDARTRAAAVGPLGTARRRCSYSLAVEQPHVALPALLGAFAGDRPHAGPPDDAARHARGRVRFAHRPPP